MRREACCIFPTFQYPELINTIKSNSLTVKSVISTPLGVIENLLNSGWQRNRPCEWRNESWLVHSASRGVVHCSCGTDTTAVTDKEYTGHCFDGACVFQNYSLSKAALFLVCHFVQYVRKTIWFKPSVNWTVSLD